MQKAADEKNFREDADFTKKPNSALTLDRGCGFSKSI
jgi:hypothetical protein